MRIFRFGIILFLVSFGLGPLQAKAEISLMDFLKNRNTGKAASDFTLKTLSGQEGNMTKYRNGANAIIFFWATWCPHCRTALSKINKDQADIEKKGIKIILVDVEESDRVVRSYIKRNKITIDVFLDQEGSLVEPYGITGVPTFYFVDKDGIIRAVEHYLPSNYEEIFLKTEPKK